MKKRHSEYLESIKDKTIEADFLTSDIYNFYLSIFKYQEDFIEKYNKIISDVSFLNSDKLPVANINNIEFTSDEKALLILALKELTDIIMKYHTGQNLNVLVESINEDNSLLEESIKSLYKNDLDELKKRSDEMKIGIDEFIFILINCLKPYLISLRCQKSDTIDTSDWFEPVCPFCGGNPEINKIIEGKENKRILQCGFCENEWKYRRISCTICKNDNHESLGFLVSEENADSLYRIDYCDDCKGYIKTLRIPDKYEESRYDLTVENIVTNYLDASAIEMGYKRP